MSALRVLACGPATTIQDRGRFGQQRFGVSPAGAMDPLFLAAANILVGAEPNAAAIEIGPGGASFVADGAMRVALAGPGVTLQVGGASIPPFAAALAQPGERIIASSPRLGVYAYLAVEGGVATLPDMGSRATHRRSGLGGQPLAAGDRVPVADAPGGSSLWRLGDAPRHEQGPIRVLPGPQDDHFTDEAWATLTSTDYRVSAQADRMGAHLDGPALAHARGYNIVSDGIATGSIQIPGDGRPIVLLRDRQTTGGYPKIATIVSADIGRFAQIPPGAGVRFRAVTLADAIEAARTAECAIAALARSLVPLDESLTSERLLALNLIGGVTSALPAPARDDHPGA